MPCNRPSLFKGIGETTYHEGLHLLGNQSHCSTLDKTGQPIDCVMNPESETMNICDRCYKRTNKQIIRSVFREELELKNDEDFINKQNISSILKTSTKTKSFLEIYDYNWKSVKYIIDLTKQGFFY